MTAFFEVLESQRAAEAFVAETGGLPAINRASQDLHEAIDQTRTEIEEATFASRFPRQPGQLFEVMTGGLPLSARARGAVEDEGEAGHKRAALEAELISIEGGLASLVSRLVELRCDLTVSQIEM